MVMIGKFIPQKLSSIDSSNKYYTMIRSIVFKEFTLLLKSVVGIVRIDIIWVISAAFEKFMAEVRIAVTSWLKVAR